MDPRRLDETAKKICRRQILRRSAVAVVALAALLPRRAPAYLDGEAAQSAEPLAIAVPEILPGTPGEGEGEGEVARDLTQVVIGDLRQSGRFNVIDPTAAAGSIVDVDTVPNFAPWRVLGVRALVTGSVRHGQQRLRTQFRLWDVEAGQQLFGQLYSAAPQEWRKVGHVISDSILERLTGERGHFAD